MQFLTAHQIRYYSLHTYAHSFCFILNPDLPDTGSSINNQVNRRPITAAIRNRIIRIHNWRSEKFQNITAARLNLAAVIKIKFLWPLDLFEGCQQARTGVPTSAANGAGQRSAQEQAEIYYGDVGCADSTPAGGLGRNSG